MQRFRRARTAAVGCGPLTAGAIPSADLALLGQLPTDLLSVEKNVGMQTAQVAFVLRLQGVVSDALKVEISSAEFHREITKTFAGRNEGTALLAFHFPPCGSSK